MSRFAEPVRAPSAKKSASRPTAARPQPRRLRPSQQAALWQVLQLKAAERAAAAPAPAPLSRGGLPERLKAGVEALSGFAMDDVRIHRNSPEPAKLGALAFTRGADIHLGPGQERHLSHEAWHVVQQKQGRVAATLQMKEVGVNDSAALESEADAMGKRASSIPPGAEFNAAVRPETLMDIRFASDTGVVQRSALAKHSFSASASSPGRPDLYRRGNDTNAKMDNVREGRGQGKDIEPVLIDGVKHVNPGDGGISTFADVLTGKHIYKFGAGIALPADIVTINDHTTHWLWGPAKTMTLEYYKQQLASSHPYWRRP